MKAANKPWINLALWLCLFCAGAPHGALAAPGDVDLSFDAGSAVDGTVRALAVQPDGKVLIGGGFTTVWGASRNRIARLNPDGSIDSTFNLGTGADNDVYSLVLQADGKVLVAGGFVSMNHVLRNKLARLNANGSVDTTFNPGTGADDLVYSLVLQSDGKVLVGGAFTTINAVSRNGIARLKTDGSLDTTFNPGTGASPGVTCLALQSDGKVLVGGRFTTINGVLRNRLARLNATGGVDTVFNPGTGADSDVYSLVLQSDGKVLVGGGFASINGTARPCLARLTASGGLDSTFNPGTGPSDWVYSLALQPDGKVLVGGQFTSINGTTRSDIARVNADGSLDSTFDPGTGANGTVNSLALQPDGKVLVGGAFTSINSQLRSKIARLFAAVTDSLAITNPPRSQTVAVGSSATFSVGASGTAPLTYQWLKDGQCLAGATNMSYGIASAQFTDAGAYSAWVRSWGGSITSAVATLTVTNLTTATLTVLASPASGGTVAGSGAYTVGSSQTISATANGGWVFAQWQDGVTNNSRTVTVPAGGAAYTATFLPAATLTVVANPTNGGFVAGGGTYAVGSSQTISATPSNDWVFAQWQDGLTNNPCTVTVPAGGATYIATFLPPATLTVVANPSSGGTVSGAGTFQVGSSQTISATPSHAWVFAQWQDGVTNNPRTVTVSAGGATYTATFLPPATLTVVANPTNGGFVAGGGTYAVGSSQTISATANSGWVFTQWQDAVTNNPRTVTVAVGGATYTATFLPAATLTVLANPTNGGFVAGGGSYAVGNSQTISATASNGWVFTQWQDGVTNNARTVMVPSGGAAYTATFLPAATLTVAANPTNGGFVAGGGSYAVGSSQTISAMASNGWVFTQWQDGVTNNPRTVTVPVGGVAYTATFTFTSGPGGVDPSFNAGLNVDGSVYAMVVQPDGKILIGGAFTSLGGQTRYRLARLGSDGTLDTSYDPGADNSVYSLAVQADGHILVGGSFTNLGGQTRNHIGRLNADGTLDASFNPGANAAVYSLVVQSDGTILVGGSFTNLGDQTRNYIGRLNADGTLDASFTLGANKIVYSLAVQPDDSILVGGSFTNLGGQTRKYIGRLNADGTLDTSFNPGANARVSTLAVQADGNILVGGLFTQLGGQTRNCLGRLNADGTPDASFNPGVSGGGVPQVLSLALQTDGKILLSGLFSNLGDQTRNYIGRLNADGTLDASFNPEANDLVYALAVQADGKILVGGSFTTLGGQTRNCFGRLNNTGTAFQSLTYDGSTISWLRGGTSPEVWRTTFEITTNGTNWTSLGGGSRMPGGWRLSGVSLSANDTLRARASVAQGYRNASGGSLESCYGKLIVIDQPKDRTADAATSVLFSVVAGGTEPLSYQWLKDAAPLTDGGNIAGSRTALLTLTNVMGGDAAGYRVVVSNASGSVTSAVAILTVMKDPWITLQPTNQNRDAGQSATFSVTASGTAPLSYQWWKDGAALAGGTGPALTLTNLLATNAGSYYVVVSNAWNTLTSALASLTVRDPVITVQPTAQTRDEGQSVTLNVTAIGTTPVNYQWWKDGTALVGANSAALTLTNLQASDAGLYYVVVNSPYASLTSAVVEVSVTLPNLDAGFDPQVEGEDYSTYVDSLAVQPDGRVLIGGCFMTVGGQPRRCVARVNANGTLDTSFNPSAGGVAYPEVYALGVQADGKILAGGAFTALSGQTRWFIGRLNADGTLDTSFNAGANSNVCELAVQADGKILAAGFFTTGPSHISRLNADGTLDASFNPGYGVAFNVTSLAMQTDGKILLGGWSKVLMIGGNVYYQIARLNADGTVDGGFNPAVNGYVSALAVQADGKILVGGWFSSLGGQTRTNIARLNANGTLDASFNPGANNGITTLVVQADGKILVGGYFSALAGRARNNIGRLNADGTLDTTFNPGASTSVFCLAIQADGKIIVGGMFTALSGQTRYNIGRLSNTGPATQCLTYNGSTVTWLRGGTSPEVWRTTFEYSPDGATWTSLGDGVRIPGGWQLTNIGLPSGCLIRARGFVTVPDGSTYFVESQARADAPMRLSFHREGAVAILSWTGSRSPYQLQQTSHLENSNSWQDVGAPMETNCISLPIGTNNVFLRVRGQ